MKKTISAIIAAHLFCLASFGFAREIRWEGNLADEFKAMQNESPVKPANLPAVKANSMEPQNGPCAEHRSLNTSVVDMVFKAEDGQGGMAMRFAPDHCYVQDKDYHRDPITPQAVREYKGNQGYDLTLVIEQGSNEVMVYLTERASGYGFRVSGAYGPFPVGTVLDAGSTLIKQFEPTYRERRGRLVFTVSQGAK